MDQYEKAIIQFTKDLRDRLLKKYREGREEHGGEPVAVQCQKEINLEVLDILNYHLIHKVNASEKDQKDEKSPG